jgi:hypothetical protein
MRFCIFAVTLNPNQGNLQATNLSCAYSAIRRFFMHLLSKGGAILGLTVLLVPFTLPAQAAEPNPAPLVAQNNPFNDVDDGVLPLMADTIKMIQSAREAMKSNDPEVKKMAEEAYNMGMKTLQSQMSMMMRRPAFRSPRP